ncbi:hypothetical protein M378DRAFT_231213 [Amanita muscaria Koide BX008]|uniref:Uncharacterized protein n=1 Tax=Amanita muscaria (strain Koide BX008) TaxID=946122 RepID=A0A0C2TVZ3_AMAMK|nr:hypothetical protein M378DRAFT_231213 [Amanita muscaria Koide BX008]
MSITYLKESPSMPLGVRIAGQIFAYAHATKAAFFGVLVWMMPSYDIRPPPMVVTNHHHKRKRRSSVDSTISESPTLIEEVVCHTPDELIEAPPLNIEEELGEEPPVVPLRPKKKQRKSQVFAQFSSSVSPMAKRIAAPAKRLSVSASKKLVPRAMVADAHAKCSLIFSNVQDHFNRPVIRRSSTFNIRPMRELPILSSCTTVARKIATPMRVPEKWRTLKTQATF